MYFVPDFAVLQPIASQLRKIHMDTTYASMARDGLMPDFPRLEELRLEPGPDSYMTGLKGDTMMELLASTRVLRKLSITLSSKPSFTGKSLAAVLRSATSSLTLKCLKIDLSARLTLPEQFEKVAPVIGDQFSGLQELDLKNTLTTPASLTTIGQKCPLLTCLKLGPGKPKVAYTALWHTVTHCVTEGEEPAAKVEHRRLKLARTFHCSLFWI